MGERLKKYIQLMDEKTKEELSDEERTSVKKEMLVQISFFQHERLIHLIVTVVFALLAMINFIGCLMIDSIAPLIMLVLLIVLLIPYIMHYYHLENGVQKLYTFYDRL